jgi:hypothetical protein
LIVARCSSGPINVSAILSQPHFREVCIEPAKAFLLMIHATFFDHQDSIPATTSCGQPDGIATHHELTVATFIEEHKVAIPVGPILVKHQ